MDPIYQATSLVPPFSTCSLAVTFYLLTDHLAPSLHWLLLSGDTQQCLCILSDLKLLLCHIRHCKSSRSTSLANLWETLSKCQSLCPHACDLDSAHITLLNCLSVDGRLQESPENLDSSAAKKLLSTLSQPPPSVPLPHMASSPGFPPRTLATRLSVFLSPVLFWSHIF